MCTSIGAQVEARSVPEKGQSMPERQRRAGEEEAKRDKAVERKCAMMLSSQEARGKTAFARIVDQDHTLSPPGIKQKYIHLHSKKIVQSYRTAPKQFRTSQTWKA